MEMEDWANWRAYLNNGLISLQFDPNYKARPSNQPIFPISQRIASFAKSHSLKDFGETNNAILDGDTYTCFGIPRAKISRSNLFRFTASIQPKTESAEAVGSSQASTASEGLDLEDQSVQAFMSPIDTYETILPRTTPTDNTIAANEFPDDNDNAAVEEVTLMMTPYRPRIRNINRLSSVWETSEEEQDDEEDSSSNISAGIPSLETLRSQSPATSTSTSKEEGMSYYL